MEKIYYKDMGPRERFRVITCPISVMSLITLLFLEICFSFISETYFWWISGSCFLFFIFVLSVDRYLKYKEKTS